VFCKIAPDGYTDGVTPVTAERLGHIANAIAKVVNGNGGKYSPFQPISVMSGGLKADPLTYVKVIGAFQLSGTDAHFSRRFNQTLGDSDVVVTTAYDEYQVDTDSSWTTNHNVTLSYSTHTIPPKEGDRIRIRASCSSTVGKEQMNAYHMDVRNYDPDTSMYSTVARLDPVVRQIALDEVDGVLHGSGQDALDLVFGQPSVVLGLVRLRHFDAHVLEDVEKLVVFDAIFWVHGSVLIAVLLGTDRPVRQPAHRRSARSARRAV